MRYTLAQWMLIPLCLFLPLAFLWGPRKALIRLGFMLVVTFLAVANWEQASPTTRQRIVGWAVVGFLALLWARGSGRGGIVGMHGRGLLDRAVGRGRGVARGGSGHAPVVPRRGGGSVVGPRPFNAGGVTYVPVVVGRGRRAVGGVARRVGRGTRRLEVVGGTAVANLREGKPPWRHRAVFHLWIEPMAWLEGLARVGRHRTVDELRDDVDGNRSGSAPPWVPSWMEGERSGWQTETDRLRDDVDRDGRGR